MEVPEAEWEEEATVGKVVVGEMLERMGFRASIIVRRAAAETGDTRVPWILDINGGEPSRLIGRQGETLAALQYVARLITSRELQKRAEFIVDAAGFKARRARGLYSLAIRMADDAVLRKTTVIMEPMPPHERRIVHLALRQREDVSTKSIGEGSGRKVTIVPNESGA